MGGKEKMKKDNIKDVRLHATETISVLMEGTKISLFQRDFNTQVDIEPHRK